MSSIAFCLSSLPLSRPGGHATLPSRKSSRYRDQGVVMTAFRKYHGLGNDFVLIDNRKSSKPVIESSRAAALCDRHTGVGADGVIFLLPPTSPTSDCAMRLFNADGSEPEMCGNGIRCLARFAVDLGHVTQKPGVLRVDTLAGIIVPSLTADGSVRVDMGRPSLSASEIPTTLACAPERGYVSDLGEVAGRNWEVVCVSMGNPHAIAFVDEDTYRQMDENLERDGPLFENHVAFPARTNTEFVQVVGENTLRMLVWERGSGRTRACGTGACATVVAAVLTGRAQFDTPIRVQLPGGDLVIEWEKESRHVFMTGPAELVYTGTLAESYTPVMA